MESVLVILMFVSLFYCIMLGIPVAFSLLGVGLLFGVLGSMFGLMSFSNFAIFIPRVYGVMGNIILIAIPLFVFMGFILEKSNLAKDLLDILTTMLKKWRGGLACSVVLVGALLAASTGIIGATVVTLGILALPSLLKEGYSKSVATGTIAASGTLGQIIPPSIVLILLGDIMNIDVGSLFSAAILPGAILVACYMIYLTFFIKPTKGATKTSLTLTKESKLKTPIVSFGNQLTTLFLTGVLVLLVLGSIMGGIASPTEAAGFGAFGGILIALSKRRLNKKILMNVSSETVKITSMVFALILGAQLFGLIFRLLGGDALIEELISNLQLNRYLVLVAILLLIFFLGFFLDFLEICFIVIPIIMPILHSLGFSSEKELLVIAILISVNLQTSFLTPPFGFALFYLKAVVPKDITIKDIYRGIVPFIIIQIIVLILLACFPAIITTLPSLLGQISSF